MIEHRVVEFLPLVSGSRVMDRFEALLISRKMNGRHLGLALAAVGSLFIDRLAGKEVRHRPGGTKAVADSRANEGARRAKRVAMLQGNPI